MVRRKYNLLIPLLFCLFFSAAIYAVGIWDGGGGADRRWNTAANWDDDVVPTGSTVVYIRKGTTSADGPLIDSSVNLTGLTGAVHVSQNIDASNYVTMTGGTYATTGILYLGNRAGYKGYWDIQGGEATFGDTWVPAATGTEALGVAEGYLEASGGILNCTLLLLGRGNGPTAEMLNISEVNMTGSSRINLTTVNADSLVIGYAANTSSTLTIDDDAELHLVAGSGVRFARSGGAAVAILNMKGGLLNMPGTGTNAISLPHGAGTGYINMTGGTINVPNIYMSAAGTPSTGVVNITGGTINVADFWQAPRQGGGSTSIINMGGGTINVNGHLALGWNSGGSAEVNMTAGTINAVQLSIALNGTSTLAMSGGAINAGTLNIGATGVTHSTLSGGTITADVVNVGSDSDLTISGTGTLKLKGPMVVPVYQLVSAGKLKTVTGRSIYAYYDDANDETVVTAVIVSCPAESLPIIDDFSVDSHNDYTYSSTRVYYPDSPGTFPDPWAVQDGEMTPVTASYYQREKMIWTYKNAVLAPGDSISVDITMPTAWLRAGLSVDGRSFIFGPLGRNGNGFMLLEDANNRDWALNGSSFSGLNTLLLTRGTGVNANTIRWILNGTSCQGCGHTTIDDLPQNASFGLIYKVHWDGTLVVSFDSLRHGVLPAEIEADLSGVADNSYAPWVKDEFSFTAMDYDVQLTMQQTTFWTGKTTATSGPITAAEIEQMQDYLDGVPLPYFNNANALLTGGGSNGIRTAGGMFDLTEDTWFLDNQIEHLDRMLYVRNDPNSGATYVSGEKHAAWDNFLGVAYDNAQHHYSCDMSIYAPYDMLASCALSILKRPALWNQTVPVNDIYNYGQTYYDRAVTYVLSIVQGYDDLLPYILERDYRLELPDVDEIQLVYGGDGWAGRETAYNRWFFAILAMPAAAESLEILGIHSDKVQLYDNIVQAAIDHLFTYGVNATVNGWPVMSWNFATWSEGGSTGVEDIGHAVVDVRGLLTFYKSGRYDLTNAQMTKVASTFVERVFLGNGTMTPFVDGSGTPGALSGLLEELVPLYQFRPELYDLLKDYCASISRSLAGYQVLAYRSRFNRHRGDLNIDGVVDVYDLQVLINNWLTNISLDLDIYEDGKMDMVDFSIMAEHWLD